VSDYNKVNKVTQVSGIYTSVSMMVAGV